MITGSISVQFNEFPDISDRVETSVRDAIDMANQVTVMVADPLTRRDTGALVTNKRIESDGERGGVTWVMPYAAYQNFGTYKMTGTHFATTGAEAGYRALIASLVGML